MKSIIETAIRYPRFCLLSGLLFVIITASGLHKLVKNTATDAFIPDDHPSIVSREKVKNIFGLQDPLVISITSDKDTHISMSGLSLLLRLHRHVAAMDNVRQVKSLVSEAHIHADQEALYIEPLLDSPVTTVSQANDIRAKALSMRPFVNTLIASDGSAVSLIVELFDQTKADANYTALLQLLDTIPLVDNRVYVAGQGAVGGYLSQYIDADARQMQPVVVATILLLLFLAFRQLKGLLGPLIVIVASAIGAVGTMSWLNVPYYAITSALPVVITAIAVADTIHVLTAYYELKAKKPLLKQAELVKEAMLDMARPITLTTLTTIAGFIGLAIASIMPPVKYFGAFAALGVLIAWAFTMWVLPGILLLVKLPATQIFAPRQGGNRMGRILTHVALLAVDHPRLTATALIILFSVALTGASQLTVDRAQVENFQANEPIRHAHDHLNQHYAGNAHLDILVSTEVPDGLVNPAVFERINTLQDFLEAQSDVAKSLSILDPLGVLQGQLEQTDAIRFTGDEDAFAQYMLLYESSASPSDYADKIDNQYQHALIRAYLTSDVFSEEKKVVETLQSFLKSLDPIPGIQMELTGRVNVDYHWMTRLGDSHFRSIAISLALVLLFASVLFRSAFYGMLCVTPVLFAIVIVYGVMGWSGIFLEPATSMFAAIAIGVGVDFSIHFVERLQLAMHSAIDVRAAIVEKFPGAARACFFNGAALASGFATLFASQLPTLQRFGLMITLACLASFFAALFIVPLGYSRYTKKHTTVVAKPQHFPLN